MQAKLRGWGRLPGLCQRSKFKSETCPGHPAPFKVLVQCVYFGRQLVHQPGWTTHGSGPNIYLHKKLTSQPSGHHCCSASLPPLLESPAWRGEMQGGGGGKPPDFEQVTAPHGHIPRLAGGQVRGRWYRSHW